MSKDILIGVVGILFFIFGSYIGYTMGFRSGMHHEEYIIHQVQKQKKAKKDKDTKKC